MSFPYFELGTPETSGDPRRSPPYKEICHRKTRGNPEVIFSNKKKKKKKNMARPCEGGSYRFVPGFVVIRFSFSINKSRHYGSITQ